MKVLSSLILSVAMVFCFMTMGQRAEGATNPALSTSSSLSLGSVALGSSASKELTIKNSGKADLTVGTPTVSDSEFTADGSACTTLAPGASCVMVITFTPAAYAATAKTATLTIPSNDPGSPKTVRLRASCPPPKISGVPRSVNFGTKTTGSINSKKFTITNKGVSPLKPGSFVVSNADSNNQDFSLSDDTTCEGASLAKGESCVVWIYFKPLNAGARTGSLTFTYNDSTSTSQSASVALKGTAKGSSSDLNPVINSFSASPTTVTLGGSTVLSWDVSDAISLSIDQGIGAATGTSVTVTPAAAGNIIYTLTATNAYGTRTATTTVTVSSASQSPPVISSFSASPATVTLGGSTVLSWNVTGATSLSIDHGVGTVAGTSVTVIPAAAGAITYTLTAVNENGTSTATATVTVTSSGAPGIDISSFAVSKAESASTYDPADIVSNTTFTHTVLIDFTANTAQLSTGAAQDITADGVTLLTEESNSITVAKTTSGITITSTLDSLVNYSLSGTLGGTLTVSSSAAYELYLNGVTINGSAGPALNLASAQKVFLVTASGTVNTLTDQSTRDGLTMKAALFGKGVMVFSGEGRLTVTGNYKHAIFGDDYIRVRGGALDVAVTARDAIRTVNGFIFDDGVLTINATGTTLDEESKGIKVEGSDKSSYNGAGRGCIIVNGGYITVTSVGKAITASWDIDEDATTATTADDPDPYVEINNGVITITTTGTPYEYVSGGTTVSCSPEGIEAKSDLVINSGYLDIVATDDALNAGKSITIGGGYIYAASSTNDAIDSNGTMTITGGVIVAIGAREPESAFDCDQNTFSITGGTFVGIAGATSTPTASACTQNAVILGIRTTGTTLALKASSGTVAFAFTIPQSYTTMLLSSPTIATGTTYTIYTGGTASAQLAFNGLYLGTMSYSGGTAGTSFTVSGRVTNLGK